MTDKQEDKTATYVKNGVIIIGGIAITAVVAKVGYTLLKKNATQKEVKASAEEIEKLSVNTSGVTLTTDQVNLICQNLVNAMDYDQFIYGGTDETSILSNLQKCKTSDDLLLVIKTFGIKPYDGVGLANNWIDRLYMQKMNLIGWLKAELSGTTLTTVKKMFTQFNIPF